MAQPSTVVISATVNEKQLSSSISKSIDTGLSNSKLGKGVETRAFQNSINQMAVPVRQFGEQLDRANKRVVALGSAGTVLYGTIRAFKEMVNATMLVEKSLTSINSIFTLTERQLDSFSKNLFDVARLTGQSFAEVAKAAEEFSRQGLGVAETAKRTRDAMILVRLTGLDAAKSVELLTAAMNTFGKTGSDTTQIINKLVAVDQNFAVSTKDIAEAISRVGSVVDDAGVSLDQFAGLVTAAKQITSRDGAVIGNALKTIFTRLERSTTLEQIEALGVGIRDLNGELLPTLRIFDNLSKAYGDLTRSQQQQIAELGGGVFQINQFKALLLDLGKANGVAAQATKASSNAFNEALIRNASLNNTLAASIQNLKTSATQASATIGELTLAPALKSLIGSGNIIADLFRNISSTGDTKAAEDFGAYMGESILKGLGNVLAGPGLIFALRAATGIASKTLREAGADVRESAGFTNRSVNRGIAKVFGGETETTSLQTVNSLLSQGTQEEQARYRAARSVAEQEEIILSILQKQVITLAQIGGAVGGTATRGARRTPGAAGGYLPLGAEAAAVAAGVGGAPRGARPVYLPGFRRPGGATGIVANTSEFIVPGAAGGFPAIYNRDMIAQRGLPPGATPVAAGGFVPNAAQSFNSPESQEAYRAMIFSGNFLQDQTTKNQIDKAYAEEKARRAIQAASIKTSEEGFKVLEKERMLQKEKAALTSSEIRLSESALSATQKIYEKARDKGASLGLGPLGVSRANQAIGELGSVLPYGPLVPSTHAINQMFNGQSALPYGPLVPSTFAANQAVARLGGVLPYGPASPSAATLSVRNAPIYGLNPQIGNKVEVRSVPTAQYQVSNAGILNTGPSAKAQTLAAELARMDREKLRLQKENIAQELKAQQNRERLETRANRVQGGLIAGSFASAFIPEGTSGQLSGQLSGGLSGGLQTASIGSAIGSIFGPAGTILGAAIGGFVGSIKGFVDRSSVSFEELAKTLQEKSAKISAQIDATSQAFQLNERALELTRKGGDATAINKQLAQEISKILDPNVRKLLTGNIGDPETPGKIADILGAQKRDQDVRGGLLASVKGALATSSTYGLYGYAKGSESNIAESLSPILSNLNLTSDQVKFYQKLTREDPSKAYRSLTTAGGFSPDETKTLTEPLDSLISKAMPGFVHTKNLFENAMIEALDNVRRKGFTPLVDALGKTQTKAVTLEKSLRQLGVDYDLQGKIITIKGNASAQIEQTRQQIALANPSLTEGQRLLQSGNFARANIETQFGVERRSLLTQGKGQLIDVLANGRIDTPQIRQRLQGISSEQDLVSLRDSLETESGRQGLRGLATPEFKKSLNDLIERISLLNVTEAENVRATSETNTLLQRQYNERLTFFGALDEDRGAKSRSSEATASAINRRELSSVIEERIAAEEEINYRANLRSGEAGFTERGFNTLSANNTAGRNIRSSREQNQAIIDSVSGGSLLFNGSQLEGALLGQAQDKGRLGDSRGSFVDSFKAKFEGLRRDLKDLSAVGAEVASSLSQNLGNAFGDFVTGAKNAKDAFRSFVLSVLGDAARAFASKAVQQLLGLLIGSVGIGGGGAIGSTAASVAGVASGGFVGLAGGGRVPTLLTGGEYVFSPSAASRVGSSMLNGLNRGSVRKMAGGGALVTGGSGLMDDVPAGLKPGSFVVRKAMVQHYGASYLSGLANGGTVATMMADGGNVGGTTATMAMPPLTPLQFADGGAVPYVGSAGSGATSVQIGVTVNDNRTTTTSATEGGAGSGAGGGVANRQFGEVLTRRIQQVTMEVLQQQQRVAGILRPQSQLRPS